MMKATLLFVGALLAMSTVCVIASPVNPNAIREVEMTDYNELSFPSVPEPGEAASGPCILLII